MDHQTTSTFVVKAAKTAEVGGGTVAFFSAINAQLVLGVLGLLVGVAGFVVNWVYKQKHYELALRRAGLPE